MRIWTPKSDSEEQLFLFKFVYFLQLLFDSIFPMILEGRGFSQYQGYEFVYPFLFPLFDYKGSGRAPSGVLGVRVFKLCCFSSSSNMWGFHHSIILFRSVCLSKRGNRPLQKKDYFLFHSCTAILNRDTYCSYFAQIVIRPGRPDEFLSPVLEDDLATPCRLGSVLLWARWSCWSFRKLLTAILSACL